MAEQKEQAKEKRKVKPNSLLICALIIAAVYLIYSVWYWFASSASAGISTADAIALVLPHLCAVALALVFNVLAIILKTRALSLVAGILYTVSMLLFPIYFFFVIAEAVLCFVAFARKPKTGRDPH